MITNQVTDADLLAWEPDLWKIARNEQWPTLVTRGWAWLMCDARGPRLVPEAPKPSRWSGIHASHVVALHASGIPSEPLYLRVSKIRGGDVILDESEDEGRLLKTISIGRYRFAVHTYQDMIDLSVEDVEDKLRSAPTCNTVPEAKIKRTAIFQTLAALFFAKGLGDKYLAKATLYINLRNKELLSIAEGTA